MPPLGGRIDFMQVQTRGLDLGARLTLFREIAMSDGDAHYLLPFVDP